MCVFVHKSAFWVLLKGQNTKILRFFFAFLISQGHTIFGDFFCEKKLKNHGYKNAKEKSIFIFLGRKVRFRCPPMVKTSIFLCFWHLWTPKDPLSG